MAGLKIDNLSDSLLEYLEGLGLSEEQVQQLIDNISGDLSALQTTDKIIFSCSNKRAFSKCQ